MEVLQTRAALDRQIRAHSAASAASGPGAPSTITNSGRIGPRASRSSRSRSQTAVLQPPMFLMESSTFWPSRRTPMAAGTEMSVAFRSSRALIPVPSRSDPANAIDPAERVNADDTSSARLRAHRASRSTLALRRAWLTTSLPTAPGNSPQGALDAPDVGAGEMDRGDRGLGLLGQPLMTGPRLRAPSGDPAGVVRDPGARRPHRFRPEPAGALPFAMPVAIEFRPDRREGRRESGPAPPRKRLRSSSGHWSAAVPRSGRTRPPRTGAQSAKRRQSRSWRSGSASNRRLAAASTIDMIRL